MKKGISLVALVITIVVLVIITGTVVLTLINNGIIGKGKDTIEEYNKTQVYDAVQQEVLIVQQENIGLRIGSEFARELDTKLKEKYPNSSITAIYNDTTKKIDIEYTLDGKTYSLALDEEYSLELIETPLDSIQEQIAELEPVYEFEVVQSVNESLWTTIEDSDVPGSYIITGYTGTGTQLENVTIPNMVGSKRISKVGNGSIFIGKFKGKLTIANGLYIQRGAFGFNVDLTEIEMGHSVETAGGRSDSETAFYYSNGINKLIIGDNCTIGGYTFCEWDSLTNISIGNDAHIGYRTFYKCTNATFTLGKLKEVGEGAFYNCTGVTSIILPKDSTTGTMSFSGCTGLINLVIGENCTIGSNSFADCSNLPSFIIGTESVLGTSAFVRCNSLTKIRILNNCIIGLYAFQGVTSIDDVVILDDCIIDVAAFRNCTNLLTVSIGKNVEIRGSDNTSYGGAFIGCTQLKSVTIGDGASIDVKAFSGCTQLENIIFGNRVIMNEGTSASSGVFYNCPGIKSLVIGDTCTISQRAFQSCNNLTTVTIGNDCTIGNYGFYICSGLTSVTIGNDCILKRNAFSGCTNAVFTIGSVKEINAYAFGNCSGLTNITIAEGCVINDYAFNSSKGLIIVTIPGSVQTVGQGIFGNCTNLTTINVYWPNETKPEGWASNWKEGAYSATVVNL